MPLHAVVLALACVAILSGAENRLRNGSFEGTDQYWCERGTLVDGDAAHGRFAMRLEKGKGLRSMPFRLEPGRTITVSMSIKGPGDVGINLSPANRGVGQSSGWAWAAKGRRGWQATAEWKRVTVDIDIPTIDAKGGFAGSDHGWWDQRSWIVMIGTGGGPVLVDGISIAEGAGAEAFVPYAPVELALAATGLPGYQTTANLLDPAKPVALRAGVMNPGGAARSLVLRFEQLDYRGERSFAPAIERSVQLAAGATAMVDQEIVLAGRGLLLARVTALEDGKAIASSDQPLTALAFPKSATSPDPRERFGASVRSLHLADAARAIGLGWTRWYGGFGWESVQKDGPGQWTWPDGAIDDLAKRGIAPIAVLWAPPKWAQATGSKLPKDMADWQPDDPRWDDLAVGTAWDRFVSGMATRYKGRPIAYEFINEPDLGHENWHPDLYARLARRTCRLIKAADPQAPVLVNVTWPGVSGFTRNLLDRKGLEAFDVHSFHNYAPGELSSPEGVSDVLKVFTAYNGGTDPGKQVWFDEGWIHAPSSLDYPQRSFFRLDAVGAAEAAVRSAAGLTAAGLDKFVTFHIGYGGHPRSWWDWVGSGTEWWDDHGNPTVMVGLYNTCAHYIGLSERRGTIQADGAVIHVFHDLRSGRGVAALWTTGDKPFACAAPLQGLQLVDLMGNPLPPAPQLVLPGGQRPLWLVASAGTDGAALARALEPLRLRVADDGSLRPPRDWEGSIKGSLDGNPFRVAGAERWRLDQVWPDDPAVWANYRPMPWSGTEWQAQANGHGGQPGAKARQGRVELGVRAAWGGNPGQKLAALSVVVPQAGRWRLTGSVRIELWDGRGATVALGVWRHPLDGAGVAAGTVAMPDRQPASLDLVIEAVAGERIALVPRFPGMHQAGTVICEGLRLQAQP